MKSIHDIKMKPKLIGLFLLVGLVPLLVVSLWSGKLSEEALLESSYNQLKSVRQIKKAEIEQYFRESQKATGVLLETVETLRSEAMQKLTAVREIKKSAIERYFQTIQDQIITFSESYLVVDNMDALKRSFKNYRKEMGITAAKIKQEKSQLKTYYTNEFSQEYQQSNLGKSAEALQYFNQLDDETIALQYSYIKANKHPLGSKHLLDKAGDKSSYNKLHGKIHPIIRNFLDKFGYYDIFLVDSETGKIVYSVFKELDYGTSLLTGPYARTNFGEAFRRANAATQKEAVVLVDYKQYFPSYEAPASFIASPIFDGNKKVGVALFQMPINRLNEIMSERVGLGKTGDTYLVGSDYLMRSDSSFDSGNRTVAASFRNPATGSVETKQVRQALSGVSGTDLFANYHGDLVLTSFTPVNLLGLTWALLAEVDIAEAFAPIDKEGKEFFAKYSTLYGFEDLVLITGDGYAFYSIKKAADYQTNLLTGKYRNTNLGKLVKSIMETHQYGIADFASYPPAHDKPALFVAQPLLHHSEGSTEVELVVAIQLPLAQINRIMKQREGMGETGESYLVGSDKLMRSDSFLDPAGHSVEASFAGSVSQNGVDTEASRAALQGKVSEGVITDYNGNLVLSAYTPLAIKGLDWALLAEIDEAEVEQPVKQLLHSFIVLGLVIALAVSLLAWIVATALSGNVMQVLELVKDIAQGEGDLTKRAEVDCEDECGDLARWFNRFVSNMHDMVSQVKASATTVAAGASQIATGNDDLSQRSQEQASALEETAATVEEMSANIRANSENSLKANEIAKAAVQSAHKGEEVVQKTIASMAEVSSSSQKISEIITVVNDISFQTNLLALNAAVEAARAGEQGRGFAVVAGEVRILAGRSAEAAKEIQGLINESVEKVTVGNQLVEETGETLTEIIANINQVAEMIEEITSAGQEQNTGIEQVNLAVSQIDQAVQQNASLVEEAAATSENLAAEAHDLERLMSQFKVSTDDDAGRKRSVVQQQEDPGFSNQRGEEYAEF